MDWPMNLPGCGEHRGLKLAELMPMYGDVQEEMQDPGLTPVARLKYHT